MGHNISRTEARCQGHSDLETVHDIPQPTHQIGFPTSNNIGKLPWTRFVYSKGDPENSMGHYATQRCITCQNWVSQLNLHTRYVNDTIFLELRLELGSK